MGTNFNRRAQRGGEVAHTLLAWIFRACVFLLFAPIALRYALRGAWFECALAAMLAVYAGALLAPRD